MVRSKVNAYVILVFLLFLLFTISPWYLFNNEKHYVVEEEKIELNDLEAEKLSKYYDPEREYFRLNKSQFLVEKTKFPFIRKKILVKELSSAIYSIRKL